MSKKNTKPVKASKAKVETKPVKAKVETKPVKAKVETKAPVQTSRAPVSDLTVVADPAYACRVGSIAYYFKQAFAKKRNVTEGLEDISLEYSAPRSRAYKQDPMAFLRDHVRYFIKLGLISEV